MFCCFFRIGQVVNITAKVNRAFTSSMEVCGIYTAIIMDFTALTLLDENWTELDDDITVFCRAAL